MEYMNVYQLNAGDNIINCPNEPILGVYCDSTFSIKWDYNGTVGLIHDSVKFWEPTKGFCPALTSKLIVNVSAPATLTLRVQGV